MADQRDAVEVLTHDHREVEDLFTRIDNAPDHETRRDLTEQVITELVRHSVAEEQYLYPLVRKILPGGGELADKEIQDHAEVEKALKKLEIMDVQSTSFLGDVHNVRDEVMSHVAEEEGELFPQLQRECTPEDLRELGAKIEKAKKTAPTRPHPAAPDTPPLNKILAPGAGLVDRLRDKLSGRGTD